MTRYRLYLRSRIRRELLAPGDTRVESQPAAGAERQEQPAMIYDDRRYSYVIGGREDFEAEDDAAALAIARVVYDAAGDCCDAFELWEGTRQIDHNRITSLKASALCARRQNEIIRTEEALLNSRWAIARSRLLLARFDEMRKESTSGSSAAPAASRY